MRINHNIASLNTYRQLTMNNTNGAKSLEKLSSGYRINRAGDDAAGLAISEKMRAQIRGLDMASKNSQDAISLIQTAEGALAETQSILQRMRELAVQSANDTNVSVDRDQIQKEINQLTSEINRIGTATEFNTMKLLNGDKAIVTTSTSSTGLAAGSKSISLITDYNVAVGGGSSDLKDAIGAITAEATGEWASAIATNTTGSTEIIVTKSSATTLSVRLNGTGAGSISAYDTITADANGDFVYNDHGISFTITADTWMSVTTGTVTVSGVTSAHTNISLANDWDSNSGNVTMGTAGITVVADSDNFNIRTLDLIASSAGGTVSVILKDSGNNTIFTDIYSAGSTPAAFTYDNHGITFTLDLTNASAGASVSSSFSLESLVATTTTTTNNYDAGLTFQVGANEGQELILNVEDMRATALAVSATASGTTGYVNTADVSDGSSSDLVQYAVDVSTDSNAAANAITVFNDAITSVSEERAKLGAVQNRLEHTISNLDTTAENLQASESRIRDVDMAKEMMEFTKNNILMQAAQSMLAQANQQPQGVLQLLR